VTRMCTHNAKDLLVKIFLMKLKILPAMPRDCNYVCKKKCLRTKHYPWVNYKVKKMIKCRSKKWNKFKATKTSEDFIKYKKARNAATAAIRKARCKFEKKLASNIKTIINPSIVMLAVNQKPKM